MGGAHHGGALLWINALEVGVLDLEELVQNVLDGLVWGRSAGCDAHFQWACRDPFLRLDQLSPGHLVENCVRVHVNTVRGVDPERLDFVVLADLLQMAGVGGVETPDHEHQVVLAGGLHHLVHGVLALLCSVADGVHDHVVFVEVLRPKLLHHRGLQQFADGHSLALEHRGLVRQPDLVQHGLRVEAGGHRLGAVVLQELVLVTAVEDVVCQVLGLLHVLDHKVLAGEGHGGHGLLMGPLAVHNRRVVGVLLAAHGVPDLGHPRARGVHDLHLLVVQRLHLLHRRTEGRQHRHVALAEAGEALGVGGGLHDGHVHLQQAVVDRGVVDDLVGYVDLGVREGLAGLVRHLHGPLHPPAEPVRLG
mmetsp:Transcript_34864/g.58267  ORF Transcript_34864/g.58267 Transcript_34864/m.58267 type:complete len:362 (-) Transcript_34864:703-1788(-)